MTTLEQSQQTDWLQTELELMSSRGDSPAKTSQPLEDRQALKVSAVDCGQSAPVFLGRFDPGTLSLKTSQTCLTETGEIGLSEYSGTFPRSGMMRNGTVYQLPRLAPTITEIGSGLLPTPTVATIHASMKAHRKEADRLHSKGQNTLGAEVASRMWPTPNASTGGTMSNWNRVRPNGQPAQLTLQQSVRISQEQQGKPFGGLNPTWVEWLMGFPLGHTDLNV